MSEPTLEQDHFHAVLVMPTGKEIVSEELFPIKGQDYYDFRKDLEISLEATVNNPNSLVNWRAGWIEQHLGKTYHK